jgi:hypothetical protein
LYYLHDTDDYGARIRAHVAAGRFEYIGHVKYYHVYTTHLLEKHTTNTDQQGLAIHFVRQYFQHRIALRLLFFDKRLEKIESDNSIFHTLVPVVNYFISHRL